MQNHNQNASYKNRQAMQIANNVESGAQPEMIDWWIIGIIKLFNLSRISIKSSVVMQM